MKKLTDIIIGNTEINERNNFLWNMVGSIVFSAVSMFLSICVIQIAGEKEGGILSIAITISQMFMFIAFFEQRTYQVTDYKYKYTFPQYHGAKLTTCLLMLIISTGYIGVMKYPPQKAVVIFLMCVLKMLDGYADLYEGLFQLSGRLYLSGKSMTFRSGLSLVSLLVTLLLTKDLVISICVSIFVVIVIIVIFDISVAKRYDTVRPEIDVKNIWEITRDCFPLFIGSFLWSYILSASRIAVDQNMASEYMAYYQVIFMPVSVINLFATFFFKPSLTSMSELYNKGFLSSFIIKIRNLLLVIIFTTLVCVIGAYLVGIPVLSIVSGCDLSAYRSSLTILMIAGGFNSAAYFMYYVLTIIRKPKSILFGYITAAVLSYVLSGGLTEQGGIMGATISFLIAVVYLFIFFTLCIIINIRQPKCQINL